MAELKRLRKKLSRFRSSWEELTGETRAEVAANVVYIGVLLKDSWQRIAAELPEEKLGGLLKGVMTAIMQIGADLSLHDHADVGRAAKEEMPPELMTLANLPPPADDNALAPIANDATPDLPKKEER